MNVEDDAESVCVTRDSSQIEIQEIPAEISQMISINEICRLCATHNEKLVGIFSSEGYCNDLASKLNLYLPFKVCETDELPLNCCYQCASTILAWHELFVTSVEVDQKLRSYQFITEKQIITNIYDTGGSKNEDVIEQEAHLIIPVTNPAAQLDAYCHTEFVSPDGLHLVPIQETPEPIEEPILPDLCKSEHSNDADKFTDNFLNDSDTEDMFQYQCQYCQDVFSTADEVTKHSKECERVEKPTKKEIFEYECKYCQIGYSTADDLLKHKECVKVAGLAKLENTKREFEITEEIKEKMKKEKRKQKKLDQELVSKAKVTVNGKIYYNCTVCGKNLHSPYTYVWHTRIHSGERPYVCDLCGKQFRVSQGLVRHLKETHAKIKKFACDLCGRMFATKRNVEEHRRIHTNERPYVCDLCGKSFKQKASLFVHNRSHNDNFPFKCKYCMQGFRTKPPMLIHMTRHTGDKPYPCETCGRRFRIKYELKRHKLIHSDNKPWHCQICGISFRQKRYLRNHNKANHPNINISL